MYMYMYMYMHVHMQSLAALVYNIATHSLFFLGSAMWSDLFPLRIATLPSTRQECSPLVRS